MGTITIKNLIGGSINIVTKSEPGKYMGPLCFTAQEDNATVEMSGPGPDGNITASLQISKDEQKNWTQWDGSVVNLNSKCENGKLYVKALNPNTNGFYNFKQGKGYKFVINGGKVAASGNIQYLLDPTGKRTDVPTDCYYSMFDGCTSLTTAPELPATTLAEDCYYYMFNGCTSLTTAPELPATTLASYCYTNMFRNCTSLTKAPELPATTLYNYCYSYMFSGCSSLTTAPELPATTLANRCYNGMFINCPLFSTVKMKASMNGVYSTSTHGNIQKTVEYVL